MTVIEKEIELVGSKGRRKTLGLFDSGSTYSIIDKGLAKGLGAMELLPTPLKFETAEKKKGVEPRELDLINLKRQGYLCYLRLYIYKKDLWIEI